MEEALLKQFFFTKLVGEFLSCLVFEFGALNKILAVTCAFAFLREQERHESMVKQL
ncbi:MAG: hypothetical protein K2P88_16105 [Chitinophagaceae bacterium]|uniref:hypothetical protein n=1 Tax=unclassified Paraflavitalea TaxID=2798305 RepID=UPI003D354CC0|nr:hypothetical protein [Chitinophagaceae bacterium]